MIAVFQFMWNMQYRNPELFGLMASIIKPHITRVDSLVTMLYFLVRLRFKPEAETIEYINNILLYRLQKSKEGLETKWICKHMWNLRYLGAYDPSLFEVFCEELADEKRALVH
mmetsp:Transcript_42157/g.64649  ORF Transcript_42157/g.64649 Transcript_42157/m.64649 type:complete len:113 (+) Transcript_42157:318-656(+)